ncbi:MAG: hypothetical protein QXL15_00595 [Candidatus Korarchaeota archaeon]
MTKNEEWWKHTPTDELLHQTAKLRIVVNRMIALELAKRGDMPFILMQNFRKLNRTADGWFAMHVPYLLALRPSNEKLVALFHVLRRHFDSFGDRIDTDLHSAFVAFGPDYRGELSWLIKNTEINQKVRAAAFRALVLMISCEGDREHLLGLLSEIPNDPVLEDILPFAALLSKEGLEMALRMAHDELIAKRIKDAFQWGIALNVRKPWDWFDPENLFYLHFTNFGVPSLKGSDMCLCGSRKKLRDCCISAWHKAKNRSEEYGLNTILLIAEK